MVRLIIAIVLAAAAVPAAASQSLNEHLISRIGSVEVWEFTNLHDGGKGYFIKAMPAGPGPFPALVLVNPYAVFPEDREWETWLQQPPYYDRSLPDAAKILRCQNMPSGDCPIVVEGAPDISDAASLGDVFGEGKRNSIAAWALANGCVVIIPFARHYKARDIVTVIYDIAETIWIAKTSPLMAPTINGGRIGAMGKSQGGQLVIHALAFLGSVIGRNFSIKSAVTVGAWIDGREICAYYANQLPQVQTGATLAASQNFAVPYIHRMMRAFGADLASAAWDQISIPFVAAHWPNVPVLLVAGTDDMMVPYTQSQELYQRLAGTGLAELKIYQNGPPAFAEQTVLQAAHGRFGPDLGSLIRNFITRTMRQ